ncbi:uncharacterized protein DUF4349 [Dysgonomonas alginatilytica]|uniref:Uncharacterized protein DUF4349 n=1 Tax=Dysgonomonas alginatilytica TaxID=1605892 RepID=A0A2V3PPR7_9BACT|nr:DUF4349 domain-containing protein [Dysgonomonas alginatilytica]PXV64681.1 uncharacterized protein DUF4349 [Dysgonomonas alginatilytica]
MILRTKSISIILGACFLLSCSNRSSKAEHQTSDISESASAETEANIAFTPSATLQETSTSSSQSNFISSLAASTSNDDGVHKFIRTAQMKFRVKDIPKATYTIEDIIIKNNGFIIRSAINNENSYSTTTNISTDSSLVIHYSNLVADLTLRVPYSKLDTVLKQMAPLALEINYRTIEANDITLQLLSEKMKQERMSKKGKRVSEAINNKGHKLNDVMDAEEVLDNTLEETDKTKLAEYEINDQVEYSIITIKLYQSTSVYKEKVLREKPVEEYQASLSEKAKDSLYNGWIIISSLFIFLLNIWPLIIIGVIAAVLYFKYKKKKE